MPKLNPWNCSLYVPSYIYKKIQQFLSSIKTDAHKRQLVLFSASRCKPENSSTGATAEHDHSLAATAETVTQSPGITQLTYDSHWRAESACQQNADDVASLI